ncbi:MAG TPA: oligosaccharide flippase family protein [Acidimicrobiales bacterium]|nr:oligosaccharide flippase family protein [Acidimicrobiales bacterium]
MAPGEERLRFASAVNAFAGLGVYALSAITGPLLARSLGPVGRGDYAAVVVPTEMVGWLLAFGMPLAAVYYARDHDDRSLVMGSWAVAMGVGGLLAVITWEFIPSYLHGHAHLTVPWFRAFLLMAIPFAPVYTAASLLMARGKVVAFNVLRQLSLVLNTVFLVALAVAGRLTLTNALASALAGDAIAYVATMWYVRAWPGPGFSRAVTRMQVRYAARVAPGSLSNLLVARLDQFVLVGAVSSRNLAMYAVAVTGAGVSSPVSAGIAQALLPHLRTIDGRSDRAAHSARAIKWTFLASSCIAGCLALGAPIGIPLLFGRSFAGAVPLLWVLLPGQVANDVASVLASRLQADGRPGAASQGLLVAVIVTVIGLAIAVRPFGTGGAAVVTVLSQFAYLGWVANKARRRGRHVIGAAALARTG